MERLLHLREAPLKLLALEILHKGLSLGQFPTVGIGLQRRILLLLLGRTIRRNLDSRRSTLHLSLGRGLSLERLLHLREEAHLKLLELEMLHKGLPLG